MSEKLKGRWTAEKADDLIKLLKPTPEQKAEAEKLVLNGVQQDTGDKARDFCKKIAERVGIDAERLGITKAYIDPEDFTFRRTVYLDGDPLEVRWTLEGYEDIQALKGKDAAEEFILSTVEDQLKEILKC